jgi:hypothetical protein
MVVNNQLFADCVWPLFNPLREATAGSGQPNLGWQIAKTETAAEFARWIVSRLKAVQIKITIDIG